MIRKEMPRRQWFEFEDLPWLPRVIRQGITDCLFINQKILGTHRPFRPELARLLATTGKSKITDLCSGGGGPLPLMIKQLSNEIGQPVEIQLTDLKPNLNAARQFATTANLSYSLTPVDATTVTADRTRVRTIFLGFHHLTPPKAAGILADAFAKKEPLAIFEATNRSLHAIIVNLVGAPPMALISGLPFWRPSLSRFLLTWVLPIIPLMIMWDGAISCLRTYTSADLTRMTTKLQSPDYQWHIGELRPARLMPKAPFLLGIPTSKN